MKIQFIKKPWALRLHYHLHDIANVDDKQGKELIELGYAVELPSEELPELQKKAFKAKKK